MYVRPNPVPQSARNAAHVAAPIPPKRPKFRGKGKMPSGKKRKCLELSPFNFNFRLCCARRSQYPLHEPYPHRSISACPHASSELKGQTRHSLAGEGPLGTAYATLW